MKPEIYFNLFLACIKNFYVRITEFFKIENKHNYLANKAKTNEFLSSIDLQYSIDISKDSINVHFIFFI